MVDKGEGEDHAQTVHGQANSGADERGRERRGEDRACECSPPFGSGLQDLSMKDKELKDQLRGKLRAKGIVCGRWEVEDIGGDKCEVGHGGDCGRLVNVDVGGL
jgi:hypothetical protein